ncbi:acyltransferase family protein [Burkholderia multivorans]|uniref:acyltransferase family protein n=1 Tax=Burkholderia multivorans TaxID=87883 RepID=UPI0015908BE7|nr:acyltransferase [Burkholderia multivorans]MCA8339483.1 acyltransferase [Burkholderia multivorans]
MGTYRLLLAVAVLLYHSGVTIGGRAIGVEAVISFYIISGYVMTALIDRYYSNELLAFYADRAMRLFPQFLLYLSITQSIIWIFNPASNFIGELTGSKAIVNLTMVGLNFGAWFKNLTIVPQSWSLGLEWQFYLLFPFMLRARVVTFIASLLFFALTCATAWINTDVWCYRMLPGTAFIFLLGSFLYRGNEKSVWLVYAAIFAGFVITYITPSLQDGFRFEVLTGIVVGVPIVRILSAIRLGKFDALLGNLSYGVFLNHFALMWLFQTFGLDRNSRFYLPALLVASMGCAWLSYELIEKRVIAMRHQIRARRDTSAHRSHGHATSVSADVTGGNPEPAPPAAS